MKILKIGDISVIGNCPHCGSKLELENGDLWWNHDIDGGESPWVTCIVCHKRLNVGDWKNIDKIL